MIKRYQFTEYAITPSIERRVAELAANNVQDDELTFRDRTGNIIGEKDESIIDLMLSDKARLLPF